MPQNPNNLCWLDMEMTGLDPERERIIEVAMIMQQALALGVIGFVVGKITATFSAPAFPKYVLLTPMDSVAGFFAVLAICVLGRPDNYLS